MKVALLFSIVVAATCVVARRSFRGDQVLRIKPAREDQLETLKMLESRFKLDFWTPIVANHIPVDVRVAAYDVEEVKIHLTRFRVEYEVFISDVQAMIDSERNWHAQARDLTSFDYKVYHTFDEIQQWMSDFAAANPDFVTMKNVGTSFEGRQFNALSIGTNPSNPEFVINCGIHAREWVTPATCLYTSMTLVTSYSVDATITSLMDAVTFVLIPVSNPDGYAYTWSDDRMWRKTRSTGNGYCVGVDPNRNWDAAHCENGASTSTCSETYCGPSPFSEPCTLAQKNFVEGLANVQMYVDVHSYSQLWMYPYGYKYGGVGGTQDAIMGKIASDSVAAIAATHGMVYTDGRTAETIYVASGTTADYFYDKSGIKCTFATELRDTGRYGFLLPERLIQPTAEETMAAFWVMAQAIVDGKCSA